MLEITRERIANNTLDLIQLKGALDAHTARDFDRFFQDLTKAGTYFFIIEASLLETVSSGGIASIMRLLENTESAGGRFVFLDLSTELEMLFAFLGLNQKVSAFLQIEEAVNFLQDLQKSPPNPAGKTSYIPEVKAKAVSDLTAPQGTVQTQSRQASENVLVACSHCGLPLRAHKTGPYMCPGCGHQFQVNVNH